jgi:uroporphyrin-III C-methyltransferase/precorrin-2 dehydrogenase/sirohydrochlorin ferrochelatase
MSTEAPAVTDARISSEARPPWMDKLARLPVFLSLEGKRAVIAGGNAAVAWKAELLSAAAANVDVYAEAPSDELEQIAVEPLHGAITLHRSLEKRASIAQ